LQEQLKTTLIEQKEFRICLLKTQPQNDKLDEGKVNVLQEQIKSVETQDAPIVTKPIDCSNS
jgi:HlyD family secretion protein